MKVLKQEIPLLFILFALGYTFLVWDKLPESVPTHFDMEGNPNGYTEKGIGLFLLPMIGIIPFIILSVVKYAIPEGDLAKTEKMLFVIKCLVMGLIAGLHITSLQYALGNKFDFIFLPFVFIGVILSVSGNYMRSLKTNLLIGIRTPWTLKNEIVWKKTHQFGATYFFYGGIIFAIISFFLKGNQFLIMIPVLLIFIAIPIIKSYLYYKEEENKLTPKE